MLAGKLYKMGRATLMLRCVVEMALVLVEVHKSICESHIGEIALTSKILRTDTTGKKKV